MQDPQFDIASLHRAYAAGADPRATVETVYRRIAAVDDPGIFITLRDEAAVLADAAALGAFDPETRPLWGVPFAVKDNIDAAGFETTAGCPDFAYRAERDAPAVALLKAAGALLIGKTNLDQFATGLVGVRTPFPVPRNAIDPRLVPGGSSSGSAVAVAQGVVSFALGTDTAGSGRVPAGLNNIVGLKPSLGAVSTAGVVPACRTLDCVSVFALSAGDAWRVLQSIARFDRQDPYSRPLATGPLGALPPLLRVGVPDRNTRRFFGDRQAEAAFAAALDDLEAIGIDTVELNFTPFSKVAAMLYQGAWVAERYAAIEDFIRASPGSLHPVTRRIIEPAAGLCAVDAFKGFYRLAALKRAADAGLDTVDLLCVPTFPRPVTLQEIEADPIGPNSELGTYTNFVNLLDLCALAVPSRARGDGLPGSVTLIARRGRDAMLAGLAGRLHAASGATMGATGWPVPPAEAVSGPAAGEIEIAVVGAHMSGMALNGELLELGARFIREAETAPFYRLYELPRSTPAKPGLLRTAGSEGSAIRLEVWAVPLARIGELLARVPPPLGLATITLADGRSVKGFLVEAYAVAGARDISAFGGWRAYLADVTGANA